MKMGMGMVNIVCVIVGSFVGVVGPIFPWDVLRFAVFTLLRHCFLCYSLDSLYLVYNVDYQSVVYYIWCTMLI